MALKSRAEVQLLQALDQRKAKSASFYLKEQQQQCATASDNEQQNDNDVSSSSDDADADPHKQATHSRNRTHPKRSRTQFRHSRGSSQTRDDDDAIAQVRALEHTPAAVVATTSRYSDDIDGSSNSNQIEANAVARRDRHTAAQQRYTEQVRQISDAIEFALIESADRVKDALAALDAQLQTTCRIFDDDKRLLSANNDAIETLWRNDLLAVCTQRTLVLEAFACELNEIERTRVQQVRTALTVLTAELMITAHALPPEVERLVAAEAYELNAVVLANRQVYADLTARLATADVAVFVDTRLAFERGQQSWRRLRHDDAITTFQNRLNSSEFTDPNDRKELLAAVRTHQAAVHASERLAVLQQLADAHLTLTSTTAKQLLQRVQAAQIADDAQTHAYFTALMAAHSARVCDAQALRELLRLALHGFGALAPEGAIVASHAALSAQLSDSALDALFRMAGALRTDLDAVVKRLQIEELIYSAHLMPLTAALDVLLSALPLANVMDAHGKSAERKALQATLEKLRTAARHEIVPLLPMLQTQLGVLTHLVDMRDAFQCELEAIVVQLDALVAESAVAPNAADSSATTANFALTESSLATKTSNANDSTAAIDLQTVRKVQRRLCSLVYASELPTELQSQLAATAEQLALQRDANAVVDAAVAAAIDTLLTQRERASRLFLDVLGRRLEQQSAHLFDKTERVVKFALALTLCTEQHSTRKQYIDLSALDLLDALADRSSEELAALEAQFSSHCAQLRHAPTNAVLENELNAATNLLQQIERVYRASFARTSVAAERHKVAIDAQHNAFFSQLCQLVGLVLPRSMMASTDSRNALDVDAYLSVKSIDEVVQPAQLASGDTSDDGSGEHNPQEATGSNTTTAAAVATDATPHTDAATVVDKPRKGSKQSRGAAVSSSQVAVAMFRTPSGLEFEIATVIPELVTRILLATDASADESVAPSDDPATTAAAISEVDATESTAATDGLPVDVDDPDAAIDAAEQREASERVATEILTLELPMPMLETLVATLRDAFVSRAERERTATTAVAHALYSQRLAAATALLDDQLRMHWPRVGRLGVQLHEPRLSELVSHRQRADRQLRAVRLRADAQDRTFADRVATATAHAATVRTQQVAIQTQLPMQSSLAALQGLEAKSKKLLTTFRVDATAHCDALRAANKSDTTALETQLDDFVRMCASYVFPDVTATTTNDGASTSSCDYHPMELAALRERIDVLKTQLRDRNSARDGCVAELIATQSLVLALADTFHARAQRCTQLLAMAEGLGPKFGLPRRTAQEKYRSEVTRCDERSAAVDALLATLRVLVEQSEMADSSASGVPVSVDAAAEPLATAVVRHVLQLRAMVFSRGQYFRLLKNASQLVLTPVTYALPSSSSDSDAVLRDSDVVAEHSTDSTTGPTTFVDFVADVSARCRDDTRRVFEREGKLDELPIDGVPPSLDAYLVALDAKAHAFVRQHEQTLRVQVCALSDLLARAPACALRDVLVRANAGLERSRLQLVQTLTGDLDALMALKQKHSDALRPELCSPNNVEALEALSAREAARAQQTIARLQHTRLELMTQFVQAASAFERELVALFQCIMAVLDSSVLTLDDVASDDNALPTHQRKSLKRLRKAAHMLEQGDARDVPRSAAELQRLAQLGETPRFPRRAWPPIADFGAHAHWAARQTKLLHHDELHALPRDDALAALDCSVFAVADDGACVGLLTHTHRALVSARDVTYAAFERSCECQFGTVVDTIQEKLRDERKWLEAWQNGIDAMRANANCDARTLD